MNKLLNIVVPAGFLIAAALFAGCNASSNNAAPLPTPTPVPQCTFAPGTESTASSFPATQASGTAKIIPAISNIVDTMNAGTLTIPAPSITNLTIAISGGPCGTPPVPGAVTTYEYIAIGASLGTVTFTTLPGWTFALPPSINPAGKTFYIATANLSVNPATWTLQVQGPGVIAGQNVTFAASGAGFTAGLVPPSGGLLAFYSSP